MKSPLGWVVRAGFLVFATTLLVGGLLVAWFASWRLDRMASLREESEIAETKAGKVEYVLRGEGAAVLVFHGAPGGFDQSLLLGMSLEANGFQIVAPSRPGYLRTPLAAGESHEQQADTMAALLDTLAIPRVALLGVSAGAPAAVQFALRYPTRCRALVLASPIIGRPAADNPVVAQAERLAHGGLKADVKVWFAAELAEHDPRKILRWALELFNAGTEAEREQALVDVLGDPERISWFQQWVETLAPLSLRAAGFRNDLRQISAPDLPFERIAPPTLIVQGAADRCVPLAEVQVIAGRIPGASLVTLPNSGHLFDLGPAAGEANDAITTFLATQAERPEPDPRLRPSEEAFPAQ